MNTIDKNKKQAVIAGAGPAGLTGAYELLKHTDIHPVVFEESGDIGGISKTVRYQGNRMDIGGHRFFSKSQRVTEWWDEIMPLQGAPSLDDRLLGTTGKEFAPKGPDPEKTDRVMLVRNRISRIFYLHKFFDYPISLKLKTFTNMGLFRTIEAGCGYVWSVFFKKPETSLENFYINRFGKPLYRMFFEDYTEKVWGVHPSKLGADWGAQRVKGLSVFAILKDMLKKSFSKKENLKEVETSLIEQFVYPKLGPGQLWETVAGEVSEKGGEVITETPVKEIHIEGNRVTSVTVETPSGERREIPCDYFLSSLPLKDLIQVYPGNRCTRRRETHCRRTALPRFYHGGTIDEKTIHKKSNQNKNFRRSNPRHVDLHTGTRCANRPSANIQQLVALFGKRLRKYDMDRVRILLYRGRRLLGNVR